MFTMILSVFLIINNFLSQQKVNYKFYIRMINQKVLQRALYGIQKGLEVAYFLGSLWISIVFIVTVPIWAPVYLLTSSMCRSLNFMKRIIELPKQLFRPDITEPIRYAILKRNGKYLKNTGEEDTFLYQLYDYVLRKFLSIEEIDTETKIAEIQCETLSQWKYFKGNGIKNIKCLQSRPQILQKQKEAFGDIDIKKQTYEISQFPHQFDTMIALNLKEKLNKHSNRIEGEQKIDIFKILSYMRHHLSEKGYAIFGDFAQEQGELKVLEELFQVYGFQVEDSQNIQKNIAYAEKLIKYQGKAKRYWEEQILEKLSRKIKEFTGVKRHSSKKYFVVFILRKVKAKDNHHFIGQQQR